MAKYQVTINMDNAAFDGAEHELARIFEKLATDLRSEGVLNEKRLRDYNGNTVGFATLEQEGE